ncbi:amidohydrolase family protein [Pseudofrankia sp. BMG5.36]|uniref:amidohydrolase family protein n=1 Tax=Pseudofrankia sp. BMG5.36 TaxID=1834512 RepID=UPI0008DA6FEE|nr:amidohydrolase family protein [Pseudofrankia sp. BMG5.36]OHV44535.1 amidohydrolase [Pseudofrankia sp. BMG5.36]
MYTLFSVDDHIVEPGHVWSDRVPARYREAAPHVQEADGREFWVYEGQRQPTMGLNAVAGKPREQWGMEPVRFDDMIPGCYDPVARAADMRADGIFASVNFPTLPGFGGRKFITFADKDLAKVCVEAWNDFVLDEWCAAAPEMFVPMTIVPLWDVPLAVAEMERTLAKGAKALCFVEDPAALGVGSWHDGTWEPLMRLCEESQTPVCMHVGSAGSSTLDPGTTPIVEIAAAFAHTGRAAVNVMCSPIPRSFPDLRLVWSEGGIGWLPAALERADRQWERHGYWSHLDATKPSEVAKRNMWFCMIEEPWGLTTRHYYGVDRILFESDYPHADTPWPHTQKACAELFADVPADEVAAITHGNAEALFHFPLAVPAGTDTSA